MWHSALPSTSYAQSLFRFSATRVNSRMPRKFKFSCLVVPHANSWGRFTRPGSQANRVISHTLDWSNGKCPVETVVSALDITLPVRHELKCAGDVNPWASRYTSLHHTPRVKSSLKASYIIHLQQKPNRVGSSFLEWE